MSKMKNKNYYGNFSNWVGEFNQFPAFTLSTDSEHMMEYAGSAFKIAGVIAPNRTMSLDKIEKETDTRLLPYADTYKKYTGKDYFIPSSEEGLVRKLTNTQPKKDDNNTNVYKNLYDPIREEYSQNSLEYIKEILSEFGKAYFFPYMMTESIKTLDDIINDNLKIIGPELNVVNHLKDKTKMYEEMKGRGIQTIEGEVLNNPKQAKEYFAHKIKDWQDGAFVSAEGGASGVGCLHAKKPSDIINRFQEEYTDGRLIVQRWMNNIDSAPNVLVYVDNKDAHILTISDQIIKNGTDYYGNKYPSKVDGSLKDKVIEECKKVGEIMGEYGYRGVGGIDGIIVDNDFYFVEINPRKNHSTVLNSTILDKVRPNDIPPLSYLEAELMETGKNKSYDFRKWVKNLNESNFTYDMFLYKKKGWHIAKEDPNKYRIHDHDWDFKKPYIANIPKPGVVISKTYGSLKSEGHTRRVTPTELGRIVSRNMHDRLKQIKKMNKAFEEM
ncbi:MAG: ATP-grasp domain-containing protein [Candidatus Woesearchaeota archaeon]